MHNSKTPGDCALEIPVRVTQGNRKKQVGNASTSSRIRQEVANVLAKRNTSMGNSLDTKAGSDKNCIRVPPSGYIICRKSCGAVGGDCWQLHKWHWVRALANFQFE